ncbi:MAG TPA: MBL fold metallo-hydrolase, partial [Gaiellaceae bacterium]|nr:MBL fold metallo-hydrolase [Gaiellaceae bacterium]
DREGGTGFFIDAGGPVEPLIEAADRLRLTPTHVLLTHHHHDHVADLELTVAAAAAGPALAPGHC